MPVKPVTFPGSDSVFGAKPQRKKGTMNNVFFPSTRTPYQRTENKVGKKHLNHCAELKLTVNVWKKIPTGFAVRR